MCGLIGAVIFTIINSIFVIIGKYNILHNKENWINIILDNHTLRYEILGIGIIVFFIVGFFISKNWKIIGDKPSYNIKVEIKEKKWQIKKRKYMI